MTDLPMNQPDPSTALIRALRRVLRPLVRLMVASGITYPMLTELLKGLFVDVAQTDFRLDDKEPTDSRISLLTGLQRKDIRRLREGDLQQNVAMPESVSFGVQLVAKWLNESPYSDEGGQPRSLARYASAADDASFEDLVASQSKDIRARVVLDEWLRLGIVSLDDQDRVVLNTEAFVPQEGVEEKLYYFAHNLHDHAAAAADNLTGNGPSRLERSVYYDALSAASVAELDVQARQLGTKMLKALNRSAMEFEARDAQTAAPRHRFTCGIYFYTEPTAKVPDE
jgi:hypothetical protein